MSERPGGEGPAAGSAGPAAPRIGSAEERRVLRECFVRGAFSERAICRALGIADFEALEGDAQKTLANTFLEQDLAAVLARLFVLGAAVDLGVFLSAVSVEEAAALQDLGLVGLAGEPGGVSPLVYSPLRLVPVGEADAGTIFVASDRGDTTDGATFQLFPDIVFSAHNPLTRQFLRLLPRTPASAVLDLCSGTGVAALAAAPRAARVVAADITPRCSAFARFNVWLNDCSNVEVREGDLYEALGGERFDRILAHPPYVPALSENLIYRDGGELGDRLIRRIVAGLPEHLSPGGALHLLSIGMDTDEGAFEARARHWLGDAGAEFDVVFAFNTAMASDDFARVLVSRTAGARPEDFDRWRELFERRGVRSAVYGSLIVRRFAGGGDAQTRRVVAAPHTGSEAFESLLHWFDWRRQPDFVERLLQSRPVVAPTCQLEVHHAVRDGAFVPERFRLGNDVPFNVQLDTEGWVVLALSAFDGSRSVGDVFEHASRSGSLPPGFGRREFVDIIALLGERGFVTNFANLTA